MKRKATLSKGDTLNINLPELCQHSPNLREMVLSLTMNQDGTIAINTVYCNSTVTVDKAITGYTMTTHHHND